MTSTLYVGLMSGTSMDGIDAALVDCANGRIALLATYEHSLPDSIREAIAAISLPGENEIERLGVLDRQLGYLFAEATTGLIDSAGYKAGDIAAIGSHGQTIRHRPPSASHSRETSFTLQIGDPNTIAEQAGIATVADFRRRDMAAGGEGAPLAPAFHAAAFAKADGRRAVVNIGGIANATLLQGGEVQAGYDTGPGNTLLDQWVQRHQGEAYDRDGTWSSEGTVLPGLRDALLADPYFTREGPRSTGKEYFNMAWLEQALASLGAAIEPRDVQATLAEITAQSIANGIIDSGFTPEDVYICGGGARNTDLMRRLYQKLAPTPLDTTAALGIEPEWVEAAAFGWLAHQTVTGLPGNASSVTGAQGPRILGAVYPA